MTKRMLIFINVISFFLILYFTVLTGLQTFVSAPRFDTDYQTLYVSLHNNPPQFLYAEFPYAPIVSREEKNSEKVVETLPLVSAVNVNTPVMGLLLHPLFNVSKNVLPNVITWTVASLLGAGFSVFILMMLWCDKKRALCFLPLFALFYLSWPSVYNLRLGEVAYILLPFFTLFYFLEKKGYQASAAILMGLLSSLKLFFLIFILFYLFKKEWKLLLICVGAFLFFLFAPIVYYHLPVYHAFFDTMKNDRLVFQHAVFPFNGSFLGLVERADRLGQLHLMYGQKKIILGCFALILLGWYYFFDKKYIAKLSEFADDIRIGFLMVFALMLSPLGWVYYYVFLLIPLFVFFKIQKKYVLSYVFYFFFFLAIFSLYLAWYYSATGWLFYAEEVSAFFSLFCWMVCLCCVTGNILVSKRNQGERNFLMIAILTLHVFVNFALLTANFGIAFYLQWNKEHYLRHTSPVMTMQPFINHDEKAE